MISGCPAVVYNDNLPSPGHIKYARALAADGAQWATPVVVIAGTGWHLTPPVMAANAPVFAADPLFLRASDHLGYSWMDPVRVIPLGTILSMAVINGKPGMIFHRSSLYYMQALDDTGLSWPHYPTPLTSEMSDTRVGTSLIIADGNPATVYRSDSLGELYFIRAKDPDGTEWDQPQSIALYSDASIFALALVDGRPFVLYTDTYLQQVVFIAANDSAGASWCLPTPGVPWYTTEDYQEGTWTGPVDIAGHAALALTDRTSVPGEGTDSEVDYVVLY
jgi:hypothetical protein